MHSRVPAPVDPPWEVLVIDTDATVRGYFHERVTAAAADYGTAASTETQCYLVDLLTRSARQGDLAPLDTPLAWLLQSAQDAQGIDRFERYRQLGDVALLVYGFFSDALGRRGVDESYVLTLGGAGYATASLVIRESGRAAPASLYRELSDRFADLGAVIADVRDQTAVSEREVLRVYDRWLQTRSPRLARRLARAGLFPQTSVRGPLN